MTAFYQGSCFHQKHLLYCSTEEKVTCILDDLRLSKLTANVPFWVNYPFKLSLDSYPEHPSNHLQCITKYPLHPSNLIAVLGNHPHHPHPYPYLWSFILHSHEVKTPFISVVYQKHLIIAAILRLNHHLNTTHFRTGLLFIITFSVHEDESNVTNTQVNMVFLPW